jgi:hypothetical protein
MNIRHTLILVVAVASLLSGCATGDEGRANEAHIQRLMRHRDWPRIEQLAKAEVKKREKLLGGWPDDATYLPIHHEDKVWHVMTMTGTPNGDVERSISLMIQEVGDDGVIVAYKRYWKGDELPDLDQWPDPNQRR